MPITTPWTTQTETGAPTSVTTDAGASIRYRRANGALQFEYVFQVGAASVIASHEFYAPLNDALAVPVSWAPITAGDYFGGLVKPIGSASATAYDDSANEFYAGSAMVFAVVTGEEVVTGTASTLFRVAFSAGKMSATVPFTWAANDLLVVSNAIEAFDN